MKWRLVAGMPEIGRLDPATVVPGRWVINDTQAGLWRGLPRCKSFHDVGGFSC